MSDSSDEDEALLESVGVKWFLINQLSNRDCHVHPINRERTEFGEFHHLYSKLRDYPDRFFEYFRMSIETFDHIKNLTSSKIQKRWLNTHINPIGHEERLVLTLRYLATGSSFKSLAFSFRMGVSTVHQIIRETLDILWEVLQPLHMPVPTEKDFERISEDYYSMWNFPNCVGCVDGKHVRIRAPADSGTMFYNYKHFFSIVLQGVADCNYRFVAIDVGGYGKQSDGGTFRSSNLFKSMEDGRLKLPKSKCLPLSNKDLPMVFLADGAYPLLQNVMKPYEEVNLLPDEELYNKRHSRARKSVECAFGILYSKWRIFAKAIETDENTANKIIKACCVLHNTIIDKEGVQHHLKAVTTFPSKMTFMRSNEPEETSICAQQVRDILKLYFVANPIKY